MPPGALRDDAATMIEPLALAPAFAAALPPLSWRQLLSTTVDPVPIALLAGALTLYLWGVARQNRLHPHHRWPAGRTAAFIGGVAVTAIALLSAIGVYDDELFWDHMVQHLLLIMVAAGLFAVSSPIALAWRATAGTWHRRLGRVLRSHAAKVIGHPVIAFGAYALVVPVTHLTVFMTWVLESPAAHHGEHVLFLVVGFLFWRQILGRDPGTNRLPPAMQALYLFLAVPVDTFVGLTLSLENREIFPAEAALHRTWGPSLVTDLHVGGVIMWVGGDVLMSLAFVPVIMHWVRLEERRAVRFDRRLEDAPQPRVPVDPVDGRLGGPVIGPSFDPPIGEPLGRPLTGGQRTAGFALGTYRPRAARRRGTTS